MPGVGLSLQVMEFMKFVTAFSRPFAPMEDSSLGIDASPLYRAFLLESRVVIGIL